MDVAGVMATVLSAVVCVDVLFVRCPAGYLLLNSLHTRTRAPRAGLLFYSLCFFCARVRGIRCRGTDDGFACRAPGRRTGDYERQTAGKPRAICAYRHFWATGIFGLPSIYA